MANITLPEDLLTSTTATKRNIKTAPAERETKVVNYLRAAVYNAEKIGMTEAQMRSVLARFCAEYGIVAEK